MPGADDDPKKRRWWRWRQWRPRVSLLTILFSILLLGSVLGLWCRWEPWVLQTTLDTAHPISDAMFSKDGNRLLTVDDKTAPCIWDSNTGRRQLELQDCSKDSRWFAFLPGEDIVLATGEFTTQLWSAHDGNKIAEIRILPLPPESDEDPTRCDPFERIRYARANPEDSTLLLVFRSGCAGLWDSETGEHIAWLADRERFKQSTASPVSGARSYFAAATVDGKINIYEVGRNPNPLACSAPLIADCLDLTFAPNGQQILIIEEGRNLRIWNWRTGSEVEIDGRSESREAVFSIDNQRLAIPGESFVFRLWDTSTGRLLAAPDSDSYGNAWFFPGGQRVLTVTYGETYVDAHGEEHAETDRFRLWHASTGDFAGELPLSIDAYNGWWLAALDTGRICVSEQKAVNLVGPPMIFDAKHGALMAVVGGNTHMARSFSCSADGNRLFTPTFGGKAHIWVRQRPESKHGYMALPEFWLTATLTPVLFWSLLHDARRFSWFPARKKVKTPIPSWKRRLLAARAAVHARVSNKQRPARHARRHLGRRPRQA